jgi:predicted SAM-dependent methyltransferase
MATATHVQYGCGFLAPLEWVNFDASPTLRIEKLPVIGSRISAGNTGRFPVNVLYGDIVKGLPVPPQSCRAVYCAHVLEHLALNDFRSALVNTRKILGATGIFRLVVPDLRAAALRYTNDRSDEAAIRFMTETELGTVDRKRGVIGFLRRWLGNSQHLWMWDFQSMRRELENAGFHDIRAARWGDSEDPMFAVVEEKSRWEDAVGIQCCA